MCASFAQPGEHHEDGAEGSDNGPWRVQLLDGFELTRGGQTVEVASRERRLLALLALQGQRPRAHLAGVLWPDSSEDRARGSLRAAVWRLQHALPGLLTEGRGPLGLGARTRVDTRELLDLVTALSAGAVPIDPAAAVAVLARGELLPGWYDDWALFERERLQQLRLRALERLADDLMMIAQHEQAMEAAIGAVAIEPLRESSHRALIRVHLAVDNTADAVRVYRSFRDRLRTEMGITPSEQILELIGPVHLPRVPTQQQRSGGLRRVQGRIAAPRA